MSGIGGACVFAKTRMNEFSDDSWNRGRGGCVHARTRTTEEFGNGKPNAMRAG